VLAGTGTRPGGRTRQTLGEYELLQRIAYGGMAELFAARRAGSAEVVALKRILPELADEAVFVDMFLDEARIAASLEHPNVVRVLETGSAGGQPYMVMEHLAGRDLGAVLRAVRDGRGTVSIPAAISILRDAAAGLHYAHERRGADGEPLKIVHRDVSPRNLFITEDGTVKVLDFGIAKARHRLSQTRTGTVKGKFPYMSPEAIRNEELDPRSDVFSLGVLLWEMCAGKRLFTGASDYEIIKKILSQPIPRPSASIPEFPRELEALIMRALRSDPGRRQPSASALDADLFAVAAALGVKATRDEVAAVMGQLFPGPSFDDETTGEIATVADRPSIKPSRGRLSRLFDSLRRR
jgi:serine/threonine protein kinase